MATVRVWFHPSFRDRPRLSWLPGDLGEVSLRQPGEVPDRELLLRVHSPSLVDRVEGSRHRDLALLSCGAVVAAARDVQAQGGAVVALPALGGHHAGRAFYGGMCLFNDVAVALSDLRRRGPWRAAVLDTDGHHADGTFNALGPDAETMYVCVCTEGYPLPYPEKFDVRVEPGIPAEAYLERVLAAFVPRVVRFRPDMLVWYLGYDVLEGEYASLGFGTDLLVRLASALASLAAEVTGGRILLVLGGGKDPERAEAAIRAAVQGLSSPEPLPPAALAAPEPAGAEGVRKKPSREWVEMTFGPLASGRQEVRIGEEILTGRALLDRLGIWGEDIDPIDIVTIEEGAHWAIRYFDGEDRRFVVMEFSPELAILSETRVHARQWMGDDYYKFDWPAGCPWSL
jgi:acetoin utilization deacetylase AcuC-like enzyme